MEDRLFTVTHHSLMPHMHIETRHTERSIGSKTPGPLPYGRTYLTTRRMWEEPDIRDPRICEGRVGLQPLRLVLDISRLVSSTSCLKLRRKRLALEFLRRHGHHLGRESSRASFTPSQHLVFTVATPEKNFTFFGGQGNGGNRRRQR